jgi:predicted O-linked N-acetylglucosamine transferase (SPINDLY family)
MPTSPDPTSPDDSFDLARQHLLAGRSREALALYEQILTATPHDADAHFFRAMAKFQLGLVADAVEAARQAIRLDPDVPEFHCDLARFLFASNDFRASIAESRVALVLKPAFPEALVNLANSLCRMWDFEAGTAAYEKALALRPDDCNLINNLGMAYLSLGRIDDAVSCFEHILKIDPSDAAADSNRIYALHFHPDWDGHSLRAELAGWNDRHAKVYANSTSPARLTIGDQKIRIGYVSPDLREHVVGWQMLPLVAAHDTGRFHVTCYSGVATADAVTNEIRARAGAWREIAGLSDDAVAGLIREDRIDILIDLSLHSGGNRLGVFARRPAPVQLTYLAYPGSTGLAAMDYRFSDPELDHPDEETEHSEKTIRLPTYWCFQPPHDAPDVKSPPYGSNGYITFGCLNQFQKVSVPAQRLWATLMSKVKDSRMLIHAPQGKCRSDLTARFRDMGIDPRRINFVARQARRDYLETYHGLDIALDPFPHGGGITSCDALWMGVPVVSLRGKSAVGRGGASILHPIGLGDYVATSPEAYCDAAMRLAADPMKLAEIRSNLRARMSASKLMNLRSFVTAIEAFYVALGAKVACSTTQRTSDSQ